MVRWRWKVENLLDGADVATKAGDDYPARFYVLFEPDPSRLGLGQRLLWNAMRLVYGEAPTHGLVYLFASHAEPGQIYDNPYAPTLKMIVAQSGPENVGRWITEHKGDEDGHAFRGNGKLTPEQEEIRNLKSQVKRLEMEKDILKKATVFFAKETK